MQSKSRWKSEAIKLMQSQNQPNYFIRPPRSERDLGVIHNFLSPSAIEYTPATLEEATQDILDDQPPEVAAYDGSPDVQRSVAEEIALAKFVFSSSAKDSCVTPPENVPPEPELPIKLVDVHPKTRGKIISNTRYVPWATPFTKPIETLTTGVL